MPCHLTFHWCFGCAAYVACCGLSCLSVDTDEDDGAEPGTDKNGATMASSIKAGLSLQTLRQFWKLGLPGGGFLPRCNGAAHCHNHISNALLLSPGHLLRKSKMSAMTILHRCASAQAS